MSSSLTDQLSYSTIRIEVDYPDGSTGTGTGFFMNFLPQENGNSTPVLVTNKHVIQNTLIGRLRFCISDQNGNPLDEEHFTVTVGTFANQWIYHPDPQVDLCVMPVAQIINTFEKNRLFFRAPDLSLLPSDEELSRYSVAEEIFMIGYPNGIWDSVNNKPIFRRGVTATHVKRDYCGKREFLIDAACFPGSSGSPIYIINQGSYIEEGTLNLGGGRLKLLGILYAGPQYTAHGEIKIVNVPTTQVPIVASSIPNNLGLVIKSFRLRELESLVKEMFNL